MEKTMQIGRIRKWEGNVLKDIRIGDIYQNRFYN